MTRDADRVTRLRLSGAGTAVLVGAALLVAIGVVSGYSELLVLGIAATSLLVCSFAITRFTSPVVFTRIETPRLVARGERVHIALEASADRTVPPSQLIDQLGGVAVPIDLPQIAPDEPATIRYAIEARWRGAHVLGPLLEERSDPFQLTIRAASHDLVDEVLVHPRIHRLRMTDESGMMRQLQTSSLRFGAEPLADFRSLREYVVGDDPRLVHWPSSAKTGNLMVRDQYEPRRSSRCVVLETLDQTTSVNLFEEAVEIAASLVCSSLERGLRIVARTRDRAHPGRSAPLVDRNAALELYARVRRTSITDTLGVASLRLTDDAADQVIVVAAMGSPLIAQIATIGRVAPRLLIVRLDDGTAPKARLRAATIDVPSAEEFARRWNYLRTPR